MSGSRFVWTRTGKEIHVSQGDLPTTRCGRVIDSDAAAEQVLWFCCCYRCRLSVDNQNDRAAAGDAGYLTLTTLALGCLASLALYGLGFAAIFCHGVVEDAALGAVGGLCLGALALAADRPKRARKRPRVAERRHVTVFSLYDQERAS